MSLFCGGFSKLIELYNRKGYTLQYINCISVTRRSKPVKKSSLWPVGCNKQTGQEVWDTEREKNGVVLVCRTPQEQELSGFRKPLLRECRSEPKEATKRKRPWADWLPGGEGGRTQTQMPQEGHSGGQLQSTATGMPGPARITPGLHLSMTRNDTKWHDFHQHGRDEVLTHSNSFGETNYIWNISVREKRGGNSLTVVYGVFFN